MVAGGGGAAAAEEFEVSSDSEEFRPQKKRGLTATPLLVPARQAVSSDLAGRQARLAAAEARLAAAEARPLRVAAA
jgi:hypothetical protein